MRERHAEASSPGPGKLEHGITQSVPILVGNQEFEKEKDNVIHVFLFFFFLALLLESSWFTGASQVVEWVKNLPVNTRDSGSIPGSGRDPPGGGHSSVVKNLPCQRKRLRFYPLDQEDF